MTRLLTGIVVAGLAVTSCQKATQKPNPSANVAKGEERAAIAGRAAPASKRLVFPWSIVSGGVDSAAAMGQAMRDDAVVASHYAGLRLEAFRPEILPAQRKGHISYRIRDKVYWTRGVVTLEAGERVLSDGQTLVRGRCGNLLAATPQQPVAPPGAEPREAEMNVAIPEAQLMELPSMPPTTVVATQRFEHPREGVESREMASLLPTSDPQEILPPVYVGGGGAAMGMVAGGGSGGAQGTPGSPAPVASAPEAPGPVAPFVPPTAPLPPMVLLSLIGQPEIPAGLPAANPGEMRWEVPVFPSNPSPPASYYFPPGNHPTLTPSTLTRPPLTPSTWTPPPGTPNTPPPSGQPPPTPPPSDPPPTDPPTSNPPPDVAVPEPGAWVLIALGFLGIAIGMIRKKT